MAHHQSREANECALKIVALLHRRYGLFVEPGDLARIAERVDDVITKTSDAHLGVLRHVARILTPAAVGAAVSGAALMDAVAALTTLASR